MTNEECVKILQQVKDGDLLTFDKSRRKALDMAIEMMGNSPTQMSGASDLIRRQDAIDAIRASTSKYTGFMEMEMYTDDDAVEAIEDLPSAQPKQQWIPCSERLPDKEGMYLVTDDAGGISGIICDAFFYCDDGKPTWLLSQSAKAWMELPEVYREGEG